MGKLTSPPPFKIKVRKVGVSAGVIHTAPPPPPLGVGCGDYMLKQQSEVGVVFRSRAGAVSKFFACLSNAKNQRPSGILPLVLLGTL